MELLDRRREGQDQEGALGHEELQEEQERGPGYWERTQTKWMSEYCGL
jgi:hypothetical protein